MPARFTRLRIAGFKSFAEPVELEILPGLTGVVGPNGCGKSNVAEALRWVMGESNARSMRGAEMDDVIFTGTATRPSRNVAEAVITLSADTPFPPPFQDASELQVSRRIERGAGSTYRVNGREARARDVQVLFADLASGARSSAMISQGRVGAMVAARPDERRAVLEEAAGIGGLHTRRNEAEGKLRAAEANLDRAQERLDALAQQQATLIRQVQQATRYRAVTMQISEGEAALSHLRHARADALHDRAMRALTDARAAVDISVIAGMAAHASHARHIAALPPLRQQEAEARDAALQVRLTEQVLDDARARHTQTLAAAVAARTRCAGDLAHATRALTQAQDAARRLDEEEARLIKGATSHPTALGAATALAEGAAATLERAEADCAATLVQAAQAEASRALTASMREQAGQRHRRAQAASDRLAAERARHAPIAPALVLGAAHAAGAARDARIAATHALDRAEAARAAAQPEPARAAESAAAAAHARVAAEASALAEVLATGGRSASPLLNQLQVAAGMEVALGAAFGDTLEAGADSGPHYWRVLPNTTAAAAPGEALAAYVQGPPALVRALAAITVVDAAEGLARQAGLAPGQCLVSRDGGAWRWDGYVVQPGAPTAAAIRLRQRNRLTALQQDVAARHVAWQAARHDRTVAETTARAAQDVERQAREAGRAAEQREHATRAAHATLQERASAAAARLATLEADTAALAPELTEAAAALGQAERAHAALPDSAALHAAATAARASLASARAGVARTTAAREQLQRDESVRTARQKSLTRERADWRLRDGDATGRTTDLVARLMEAESTLTALNAATLPALSDGSRLSVAEAAHADAATATATAERALVSALNVAQTADRAIATARESLARAEQDAAHATAAWREARQDPAYRPGPVPTDLSPAAEDRARQWLDRLARERDQIGPVNLLAEIEEAAIASTAAKIASDRVELAAAIAKLRGTIGHLNREGRERLQTVFTQVDRHFQALFSRMFGGGRAHLVLVGSDDPLLAGLEIYAQPPGKKLQALSLLSGGEQALTAMSLIFAVFRCNPAPVCVLDEVDAPLDDANVERFCSLLDDMVRDGGTRFVVVTHHQLTMARMDRLYGVTMQERGVSRLLSVTLDRAEAMAVAAE